MTLPVAGGRDNLPPAPLGRRQSKRPRETAVKRPPETREGEQPDAPRKP